MVYQHNRYSMYYADFFRDTKGLQKALGDRSVVILDGRVRLSTQVAAAKAHGLQYGFKSFQLCRGDTFNHGRGISPLIQVGE